MQEIENHMAYTIWSFTCSPFCEYSIVSVVWLHVCVCVCVWGFVCLNYKIYVTLKPTSQLPRLSRDARQRSPDARARRGRATAPTSVG